MNNVSVRLIFDRKHVATKKHQASVQMEVTFQRKRKFITTGIKLYSDQWGKDGKVKNHPQMVLFNQQLADMVAEVYNFAHQLSIKQMEFSFDKLEKHLKGERFDSSDSFLSYIRKRLEERQVSEATKVRHRCVLKALEEFGKIKNFSDVCYPNIIAYDEFAKKRCKQLSSVYNYHKVLKIYIREAYASQLITTNPYLSIKLDRGQTGNRKFLTKEELAKIENKQIDNRSLCQVRDMFLFCCYTGLAYSDLAKFDFNQAEFKDGLYRIRDFRKKTGVQYNISLMDKAMNILRKYNFTLPVISLQKYNSYLKVLGAFCEVKKRLTSHCASHSISSFSLITNDIQNLNLRQVTI